MVHCHSELRMYVCSFYDIVTESVPNGTGFCFIKKILGSLITHVIYFVE